MIRYYTREAGVRSLEREISKICRKAVKRILLDKSIKHVQVNQANLKEFLGCSALTTARPPIRTRWVRCVVWRGPRWGRSAHHRDHQHAGQGQAHLHRFLGDVMQESIQAAMTVVRARAEKLRINADFYEKRDIHVHVPEGATPKDGPSAGIAMCTALVSSLTGNPVRADVAMTGRSPARRSAADWRSQKRSCWPPIAVASSGC